MRQELIIAFNPGFETDGGSYPENWAEWSCSISSWCGGFGTTSYHINDAMARTDEDCMEAYGSEYAFSYQDHAGIIVGRDYTLAVYFKDNDPCGSTGLTQLKLEYRDGPRGSGNNFHTETFETSIPDDGNWHQVMLTYTTPVNTELVTITAGKGGGSGSYLYDDITFGADFAEIDTPDPSHLQTSVTLNPTLSWVVTGSYVGLAE